MGLCCHDRPLSARCVVWAGVFCVLTHGISLPPASERMALMHRTHFSKEIQKPWGQSPSWLCSSSSHRWGSLNEKHSALISQCADITCSSNTELTCKPCHPIFGLFVRLNWDFEGRQTGLRVILCSCHSWPNADWQPRLTGALMSELEWVKILMWSRGAKTHEASGVQPGSDKWDNF